MDSYLSLSIFVFLCPLAMALANLSPVFFSSSFSTLSTAHDSSHLQASIRTPTPWLRPVNHGPIKPDLKLSVNTWHVGRHKVTNNRNNFSARGDVRAANRTMCPLEGCSHAVMDWYVVLQPYPPDTMTELQSNSCRCASSQVTTRHCPHVPVIHLLSCVIHATTVNSMLYLTPAAKFLAQVMYQRHCMLHMLEASPRVPQLYSRG